MKRLPDSLLAPLSPSQERQILDEHVAVEITSVRYLIIESGLTDAAIGRRSGLLPETVAGLRSGRTTNPTYRTVLAIRTALAK